MKFQSNNIHLLSARNMCMVALLLFAYILSPKNASAQSCASTVPSYTLDLRGHPDTVWTSPSVSRKDACCGITTTTDCILFYITLDANAVGVSIDAVGGLGSTDYLINCSNPTPLGSSTCIYSTGTFYVTICKPGNNPQQYTVTSIPKPYIPADAFYISPGGCTANLKVKGVIPSTVTWTSLSGSAYNSNLSCTSGCSTTVVTRTSTFPSYVDYKVCGTPSSSCLSGTFCDTIRVYNIPTLSVSINPGTAYVCTGTTATKVTASASGGKTPYSYKWSSGQTDSAITVGTGTYIVTAKDALGCQIAKDTVVITTASNPTPSVTGSSIICVNEEGTYFVMPQTNRTYSWNVNGGIIASGTGTNMIGVVWITTGTKTISVTETNTTTGCFTTASKSVTVHPRPNTVPIQH